MNIPLAIAVIIAIIVSDGIVAALIADLWVGIVVVSAWIRFETSRRRG